MSSRAVIRDFMTASPHTIGADQTLARAHAVMRDNTIRHLPVLHGGKLVGIITDRDIHLVETLSDVEPSLVTVSDAMTASVYAVSPDTQLEEVARTMAEHKYGSAIVMEHYKVVGIFTTVDACRALATWIASQ
jgi:acetoin utilization protein AcuB